MDITVGSDAYHVVTTEQGGQWTAHAVRVGSQERFGTEVTAGSADVISFLELDGLFNVHITGNLVIIAAHMVAGRTANTALLERAEVSSLRPLLLLAVSAAHRLSDPLCLRTVLARLPVCLAFGNGNAERVGADALAVSASSKLMRL